jgi:hypothetical protein
VAGRGLLTDGRGVSGPFYVHQDAAKAWAFSTALDQPGDEVFGAQLVCWLCAQSQAKLLPARAEEFRKLKRFWIPPVRSAGGSPVALPGRRDAEERCPP